MVPKGVITAAGWNHLRPLNSENNSATVLQLFRQKDKPTVF
jgi:hypothetical protein